jgi:hypothetical protein
VITSPSATSQMLSRRSRAEYTLPRSNASCRSHRSHAKLRGYAPEKSSPSLLKMLTSCGSTTGSPSRPPSGTVTTKLLVVAQTSAATVLELSSLLSLIVLVQTPVDPHRVATAMVRSSLTAPPAAAAVTLAATAAMAEAPTTGPIGGPVAGAVAAVKTTRTATPPEPHRAATTPARRSKSCGGRSPPLQTTTTASPPSHLDFATCSSPTSSNLWRSPSTTRSRTPSSGSGATPSPSRTLAATTTPSASTSPSAWIKPHSHGSSRWISTRSTCGTS